jgi:predicted ribosome quality control (RQC) complex YloA/Tae2 family protein
MNLDTFTISALVDEFMDTLVGGRIQDVIDTDVQGIGLEIYNQRQRHYLYLSADKTTPRLHLVPDKLRRGVPKPTQIGLLLRRYIEGGRLLHISQPPWERVVIFDIEGAEGEVQLIIEPMPRRANVLLVRDGIILDCMVRVGPEDNRYRLSLPNHAYQLPPPMTDRHDPFVMQSEDWHNLLATVQDEKVKLARFLPGRILGMSPLLARELAFRATGDQDVRATSVDADVLHDVAQQIMPALQKRSWQSGYAKEAGRVQAYAVYPVTHLGAWYECDTPSQALAQYYGIQIGADAYNEAKKPVQEAIEEARARLRAKLISLEEGLRDDAEREHLQRSGELILAYQYALEEGQTELRAHYDPNQPELVISLDPSLTPLENAQRYFDKYNRAKRAQANVPELIEETRVELNYLDQLETDLEMANNWLEIDDVMQGLQSRGYTFDEKKVKRIGGGGKSSPLRLTHDGYVIWVGRNSRQNEIVTFKNANPQDFWLHVRNVPGAHVVIRNDGRNIPESLIVEVASIAAHYSAKRLDGKVDVDVTRIKYVKKIKGAGAGMVTYRNERTLTVAPHDESIWDDENE